MVQIDKTDSLYKYLSNLGVEDVENSYIELAKNGRYKLSDVKQYFREIFTPSQTQDIDESELEKLLDYYIDLKKVKTLNSTELKACLAKYKETNDIKIRELIINSQLKDILYLCINYKTLHTDVDVQDLVQVANIGLITAIEKYNPNAKIDFKDYVTYWVRVIILNEFKGEINDK